MKDKNKIIEININVKNPIIKGILFVLSRLIIGTAIAFSLFLFVMCIIYISEWLSGINPYLPLIFVGGLLIGAIWIIIESGIKFMES